MGVSLLEDVSGTFILTFDLKVKFKGFLTWLCVRAAVLLSLDIVIPYLAHECITMRWYVTYMYIQDLCTTSTFSLNIKIIFSPWMCIWAKSSLLFDIGIPPWDNMLCTCMTSVWPRPLTYTSMWVVGVSSVSFTHSRKVLLSISKRYTVCKIHLAETLHFSFEYRCKSLITIVSKRKRSLSLCTPRFFNSIFKNNYCLYLYSFQRSLLQIKG